MFSPNLCRLDRVKLSGMQEENDKLKRVCSLISFASIDFKFEIIMS
jgi:hypothetical protein